MTTDTSFVENPPSSRAPIKFATPSSMAQSNPRINKRGGGENQSREGRRGVTRGNSRGSGIARGKPRGTK